MAINKRFKFLPPLAKRLAVFAVVALPLAPAIKAEPLTNYFDEQVREIAASSLTNLQSRAVWEHRRPELRRELAEMLGLDPMPERTDLHPVITGRIEEPDFVVEKIAFQSLPGLYVTANLYLPKPRTRPAPAILYLCGHLPEKTTGVSYGNKTAYQQHGIWLARNGYVCLLIDSLELGEIPGHHKGTYNLGMWWWNSRGYTPAGVETWDGIRALDYLCSRPEVDPARLGITGRSGGGAYSWFIAALDERVKAIAPVAGMADLRSYAVDGTVDSHCDCMFMVNTYRWDYPLIGALCAPRPLLMENSDADALFPLDGVMRTHDFIAKAYALYGARTNFGLVIAPGPHRDTQDLQLPVLRWFNIHLRHEDPIIESAAVKRFRPDELRVFQQWPADQINTRVEQSFVPAAPPPPVPSSSAEWRILQTKWQSALRSKCFSGWPDTANSWQLQEQTTVHSNGLDYAIWNVQTEPGITLPLVVARKSGTTHIRRVVLLLSDALPGFANAISNDDTAEAVFRPRGHNDRQERRRYMLVGQTLDGMRVWDICRAAQALTRIPGLEKAKVCIDATGDFAVDALYAAIFERRIARLDLRDVPPRQQEGPDYLNVLRVLDIPEALAMAAANCEVHVQPATPDGWEFPRALARSGVGQLKLEWAKPEREFKYRGTKGWGWTPEQYLEEIPWLEKFKMNFLMNCYSSLFTSPHPSTNEWWKPLPEAQKSAYASVIRSCREHGIQFCFCMNPQLASTRPLNGTNTEDLDLLYQHYAWAQSQGVQWFSICVDDAGWGGRGPSAAAAADANMVNTIFSRLRANDPAAQLIFCAGPYWGDGSPPDHHAYLQRLGHDMNPHVYVFWTGDAVVTSRITTAAARAYRQVVRHRLFLWDNYPVNDEQPTLNLGPVNGRDADLPEVIDGYMSNPMEPQNQINRIPLATCADYAWNPPAYDPARSLARAIHLLCANSSQEKVLVALVDAYPGFIAAGGGTGNNPVRQRFQNLLRGPGGSAGAAKFCRQMEILSTDFREAFPGQFQAARNTVAADIGWMQQKLKPNP